MFFSGIQGDLWLLLHNSFIVGQSSDKWKNQVSEPFLISQGVRQGGILSTDEYKCFINDLLNRLQDTGLGAKIGTLNCPSPTCADDVALVSNSAEWLQILLDICWAYSSHERYELQPTKSMIITMNSKISPEDESPFLLGGNSEGVVTPSELQQPSKLQHRKPERPYYAVLGDGLHGVNGLTPRVSYT